jgi:hypothetical protein
MKDSLSLNMRLLAHHELEGFGGVGEGMGMQLARTGGASSARARSARDFTGVDVTDHASRAWWCRPSCA